MTPLWAMWRTGSPTYHLAYPRTVNSVGAAWTAVLCGVVPAWSDGTNGLERPPADMTMCRQCGVSVLAAIVRDLR